MSSVSSELDIGEPRDDPDLTVLRDFRLVAKFWRCDSGQLRRSGSRAGDPMCAVPFGDVLSFDSSQDEILTKLIESSRDEETFLFKLEFEGFRVIEGNVSPHLRLRRF